MKFMQIKPQKARGVLKDAYWTDPEWVAEEKYDGDRRIAQFCGCLVRFTGTRESVDGSGYVEKTDNVPHLSGDYAKGLTGTVLDGEIVAPFAKDLPGGKSKYVTSIMGSSSEEAIRKQKEHGWLEYMVFDCLWYKGEDQRNKPFKERHEIVKYALEEWGNKYAKLARGLTKDKKFYFDEILARGGEGVVLKNINHRYGDESLWVKVKGEWTADVVIVGTETGKGKYAGMLGALVFAQMVNGKLKRLGSCSGFDDALRVEIYGNKHKWVGKVIEIKHNGREPTGAFRHPRFKRFRPDKSPKDCVYREDEA